MMTVINNAASFCASRLWQAGLLCSLLFIATARLEGQTYSGVNAPGGFTQFQFNLNQGATNLSITVTGSATAYSHLLLRAGSAPSDVSFDFIAAAAGSNALHIEGGDLQKTNYVLRVRTPASSAAHAFNVTIATNQTDLGSAAKPITKNLNGRAEGQVSRGEWRYYRFEVTGEVPGWQCSVSANHAYPEVYVRRDGVPSTSSWLKRSLGQVNDLMAFTGAEASTGYYVVGLQAPASAPLPAMPFTLQSQIVQFVELSWDPGTSHAGTMVHSQTTAEAGYYHFKVTTQPSLVGGWRTALNVIRGEARIFLSKGVAPSPSSFDYKSENIGSDGFVTPPADFAPGQDWYFMVQADADSEWTLVTGEPYVQNLGSLSPDSSSGSGPVDIGPEGIRYFKTTIPPNTLAWRLWLKGATNQILVKNTAIPHPSLKDLSQAGRMLVTPGYLVGGQVYFIGVKGTPMTVIDLDSRHHAVMDQPFVSSLTLTNSDFGYRTYRIKVPPDQLAWQVNVVAHEGDPNVSIRRNMVPNELNNDAYSEVPGGITDSVTLVPPTLSDGTFYVTVYGDTPHAFTLQSGNPTITDIPFISLVTNEETNRVGWLFYRIANIDQQLGFLGWEMALTNHAPGTRIAIRRNAVPGIWNYRNPGSGSAGYHDDLSAGSFLQVPGHQADIWYVGVYNPSEALGPFTLISGAIGAEDVVADGGIVNRLNVENSKWQFFRVTIPSGVLGWDLRLASVTQGLPRLVVAKDILPVSLKNVRFSIPITGTNWPTGNQWAAGEDWTERDLSEGGLDQSGQILTMGWGRPLDAGTYYVGVLNKAGDPEAMSYTLASRLIGDEFSLPVTDLGYAGGAVTNTLAPREIDIYRVTISSGTKSWKVRLRVLEGDAVLAVSKGTLPNITARPNGSVTNLSTAGKKMMRTGNEHFLLLPSNLTPELMPGVYYLMVASEGTVGEDERRIGSDPTRYVLESVGPTPQVDLGTLLSEDLVAKGVLEGGESMAYRYATDPDILGVEMRLEDRTGNPVSVSQITGQLPDPGAASTIGNVGADPYGTEGGDRLGLVASPAIIMIAAPLPNEIVTVKARAQGGDQPDASYTLQVRRLIPTPIGFDGGVEHVDDQVTPWRYFKVEVPPDAVGWDLRLIDVLAGDPKLVVTRDYLPIGSATSSGFTPGTATNWLSGQRWAADKDWTGRSRSATGATEDGRLLAMGMGRPLEPGTYYVGVFAAGIPEAPAQYTLVSRGIGDGFSIPVLDLPFQGGSLTQPELAPREAAYYRAVVPEAAKSWQLKLTALEGESMLVVLTNAVPNVLTGISSGSGKSMHKTANEHYLRLPANGQINVAAGTNYLAVISEGQDPSSASAIGTNGSSFTIQSLGEMILQDLGEVTATETLRSSALEGGQVHGYRFTVSGDFTSLEARLDSTGGSAVMVLRSGDLLPDAGAASVKTGLGAVPKEIYGTEGGSTLSTGLGEANSQLITLPVSTNREFTLLVKGRALSGVWTDAGYTLRLRGINARDVQFDSGSFTVTNQPANSWRYFVVDVPPEAQGWDIRLTDVDMGLPRMVVCRDELPISLRYAHMEPAGECRQLGSRLSMGGGI